MPRAKAFKGFVAKRLLLWAMAPLCLLALFNLAMAVAAVLESSLYVDDPVSWRAAGQTLVSATPTRDHSVILIHGFVGSPLDMKPLAEALSERGFRVVIPVMPGQIALDPAMSRGALTPEDLVDWLAGQIRKEEELTGSTPYLVGFSMGGALATLAAGDLGVERMALIAPFYGLAHGRGLLETTARTLSPILPLIPKFQSGMINDPGLRRSYSPGSYIISTRAYIRLQEMADMARHAAPALDMPVLALAAPGDNVASFPLTEEVLESIRHAHLLACPASDHVLLYDADRDFVIASIVRFLTAPDPLSLAWEPAPSSP